MHTVTTDILIIGAGGAGLRAAIAAATESPELEVTLVSKVYPMRSHTVAAEGGAAGVIQDHDSTNYHFNDTVSGGDWLCEQDVVDYFVNACTKEMIQLEHWGCPWSRKADGEINVRAFGGMKIERTWFAADQTGFHILHTLFQTSTKLSNIKRLDEFFCLDLIVDDGRCHGAVVYDLAEGEPQVVLAKSVILATGGAGRIFRYNTNGGIVTGDGMALAFRHGVALRDMEFVQYHPTGLPGTGVLMTEGCRGEGGILTNKDGYRYLQDYGLGPEVPVGTTKNKTMELGPRDKLSQAFWHEQQKGRTIAHPLWGDVVHMDLRHLGEAKINERLPLIRELAQTMVGVDPVHEPIPVRPTVHYTMGGILVDQDCATSVTGLYAVGECSSVGIHGANRLGSNSLAELLVFGKVAGCAAAKFAQSTNVGDVNSLIQLGLDALQKAEAVRSSDGPEKVHLIRQELGLAMEAGIGIYRDQAGMQETCDTLAQLQQRYQHIGLADRSTVFNTEWLYAIELGYLLDVAQAMAHSALERKESRGSHQRIDDYSQRDDEKYLMHTLAWYQPGQPPKLSYQSVTITKSPPAQRLYGGELDAQEAKI